MLLWIDMQLNVHLDARVCIRMHTDTHASSCCLFLNNDHYDFSLDFERDKRNVAFALWVIM